MKFKIGQTVEVVDRRGIAAEIGATAVVKSINSKYISVVWKRDSKWNEQGDGGYCPYTFKPILKGQQLLFSFMNATKGT